MKVDLFEACFYLQEMAKNALKCIKKFLKFSSVYTPDPSNKGRRRIFVEREGRGG
jgi:hypothetical protein